MTRNLEMSHGQLTEALDLTRQFFHSPGVRPHETILEPMQDLSHQLQAVNGYMGLLGVGYPFYAEEPETGKILTVPSVIDYLDSCKQQVSESSEAHGSVWPCAECQAVNQLPNLTDQCVPCDRVSFKPRDVFRALPDLDILTVFKETSDAIEQQVESILLESGWVRFNTDIKGAFDNTVRVLSGDHSVKLPVDFHILTFDQIQEALLKIAHDPLGEQVGIKGRSWRAKWKDQPVDISYSFIFSMTEVGFIDTELSAILDDTRAELLKGNGVEELIGVVDRSKRCGPVIGDLSLRSLLQQRIQGWSK